MVDWMRVGFVHGVMNTDNLSILGLTIDYGPYGWLEDYDPGWTPNTTDAGGRRYRYGNQPQIGQWNLGRLGSALPPLIEEVDPLQAVVDAYSERFADRWDTVTRREARTERRRSRRGAETDRQRAARDPAARRDRHDDLLPAPRRHRRRDTIDPQVDRRRPPRATPVDAYYVPERADR